MQDGYVTFELVWTDRTLLVSYRADWFNTGHCHIELRCDERLPVTETGYKSHFMSAAGLESVADVEVFVLAWLDHAATDKAWLAYLAASRQLTLF